MSDMPVKQLTALCNTIQSLHFEIHCAVRQMVISQKSQYDARIVHYDHGDANYKVDVQSELIIDRFFTDHIIDGGVTVICEGLGKRVYPATLSEEQTQWQIIIDPLDGTRHIMYDNRSCWILTGVAPNRGDKTTLADIVLAIQTEIPTTKQDRSSVLTCIRGQGVCHSLWNIDKGLCIEPIVHSQPSSAVALENGFAVFTNFFPGMKEIISQIEERSLEALLGIPTENSALVFSEQYISNAGQLFMLATGKYRLCVDFRASLKQYQQEHGRRLPLCAHPYDLSTILIAEELGAIVVDENGNNLSYPLDTVTNCSWYGYSNRIIYKRCHPVIIDTMKKLGVL